MRSLPRQFHLLFFLVLGGAAWVVPHACGQVTFSSNVPSFTVAPGGNFTFNLSLVVSGGEQVTGVSYLLDATQASNPAPGVFLIAGRNSSASVFVTNNTDSQVITSPGSILNPANSLDLGGTLNNPNAPVGNGSYTLGSFTLDVSPTATPGTYSISPIFLGDYGNGDWIGPGPDFNDNDVSSLFSIGVTVESAVPEPSCSALLLLGISALGLFALLRAPAPHSAWAPLRRRFN
jgi:hypothetical protein